MPPSTIDNLTTSAASIDASSLYQVMLLSFVNKSYFVVFLILSFASLAFVRRYDSVSECSSSSDNENGSMSKISQISNSSANVGSKTISSGLYTSQFFNSLIRSSNS